LKVDARKRQSPDWRHATANREIGVPGMRSGYLMLFSLPSFTYAIDEAPQPVKAASLTAQTLQSVVVLKK